MKCSLRNRDELSSLRVSDTSLRYDRDIKVPLYARHAIQEVWLIDINGKQLYCMREPGGESYASTTVFQNGSIEVAALPSVRIDLSNVLSF
jgi:Uma2 family endonuclease